MNLSDHAQSVTHELVVGGAKAAPAGAVSLWYWLFDRPVETWVSIAVLIFTVLQIVVLIRDKFLRDGKTSPSKAKK